MCFLQKPENQETQAEILFAKVGRVIKKICAISSFRFGCFYIRNNKELLNCTLV